MVAHRRHALKLAGLAAILPFVGGRALASADAAADLDFNPSDNPMRYSRAIERELGDGAKVMVTRHFSVRFLPLDRGFRIDGAQIGVDVDMPPSLSQLAGIEQARVEENLFPILLDGTGLIAGGPDYRKSASVNDAVAVVERSLAAKSFDDDEKRAVDGMLLSAHRQGESLIAALPQDLFSPRPAFKRETREFFLPGNLKGSMEVVFEADIDGATGVLRTAERHVLTRIVDDVRRTSERWSLTPL